MNAIDLKRDESAAMPSGWTKRKDKEDDWERDIDRSTNTYCAISNYAGSDSYCWHAVRGEARLHAAIRGREAAMQKANEMMALPIEEFNELAVSGLIDDLRMTERAILRLSPNTTVLPGYHAGYEAGVADTRHKIAAAIGMETAE